VPDPRVEQASQLTDEQVTDVLRLVEQVTGLDGVRPLSEQVMLDLRYAGTDDTRHVLLFSGERLVGYGHLDLSDPVRADAEIAALDPAGIRAVVDVAIAESRNRLGIWARGQNSRAIGVLTELGFRDVRVLLQLRRSLAESLADPTWPAGVTVRSFVVGRDEPAWLAVNNLAFASHPDQSGWTRDDIDQREREPWFDPAGFFLAERAGELVGFHWTKVHEAEPAGTQPAERIGEVYVVGVAPSMQGQHLGSALTAVGLIHLREQGLATVMLYVDESNTSAVNVYERLGFTRWDADTFFER